MKIAFHTPFESVSIDNLLESLAKDSFQDITSNWNALGVFLGYNRQAPYTVLI